MLLAGRLYFSLNRVLLHNAIDVAISKERYRRAHRDLRNHCGPETFQIITHVLFGLEGEPLVGHLTPEILTALDKAKGKAWERYHAYRDAKARVKECYKAYRKAKAAMRNYLRCFWYERIRFAGRAIGNVWDYSLEMVATPPTMVTVDEYFVNYALYIHQRGGAVVGNLA